MVYNAAGMEKQIEDCRFKENDLFVEYSKWGRLLDLSNVRSVLKSRGSGGAVISTRSKTKRKLEQRPETPSQSAKKRKIGRKKGAQR
jgi:hypothetical protein